MHRRGKSLLEVMVVMVVLAAVMAMVGRMMTSIMRADSSQSRAMRKLDAAARLAERFRQDVRAATRAELPDAQGTELSLSLDGGRSIVYRADPRLTRIRLSGEEREAFDAWPFDAEDVRFSLLDGGKRAALECRLAGADRENRIYVEAVVGFDRRLAGGTP